MYLLQSKPSGHLFIPLIYKELKLSDNETWKSAPNFLKSSIPGFTSDGKCETVRKSFIVEAEDYNDLPDRITFLEFKQEHD